MDNNQSQEPQDNRKTLLQQELQRQQGLHRLHSSVDYQNYLEPVLQQAVSNKWLDPSLFNDTDTFHKAYVESFARAAAYKEILFLIENSENKIKELTQAISGSRNKPYEF